jgi:hypothetical protein
MKHNMAYIRTTLKADNEAGKLTFVLTWYTFHNFVTFILTPTVQINL